jgi:hypothetical protein
MAEQLPDDATIEQVAEVFGVSDKLPELTRAARSLTKGQMVAILGARNANDAAWRTVVPTRPSTQAVHENSRTVGLKLSIKDIQSVELVFGGEAFPAADKVAMLTNLGNKLSNAPEETLDADGFTLYVCCCPCCCATATLQPTSHAVA